MSWSTAKRTLFVSTTLIVGGLAVCGWQVEEHLRFKRSAAQALINRGRDITSTLGVIVRSQRQNGIVLPKDRLEAALGDLLQDELESVAILGATGDTLASAGKPVELTPDMLKARGAFWGEQSLIIMNLMDLGTMTMEDGIVAPRGIVASNDRIARAFRPNLQPRRPGDRGLGGPAPAQVGDVGSTPVTAPLPSAGAPALTIAPVPGASSGVVSAMSATTAATAGSGATATPTTTPSAPVTTASAPAGAPTSLSPSAGVSSPATTLPATTSPLPDGPATNTPAATVPTPGSPAAPGGARGFARRLTKPQWMSDEEYVEVIQKQGVHSLVLSMPTTEMRRAVQNDLLLRSLVSLMALGGCVLSALAWRKLSQNSELQIRLIKAGEANTHLKEMNFAAAGLAHETRNPLNLIRGLAQMIAMQAGSSPKLKEHASTIIEEADRVTVQLNEFINYSKPREAHLGTVEVQRLVADVARTLVPDLEEKHLTLKQPESPLLIEADEQLLRQAIFNVLLNATQAVQPGGQIEIKLTQTGPREAMLEISDDGPGVPPAERANIFKPYVTMRPKGVGLGLAIVHQIASAHHWEVTCTGVEPHGALFRFTGLKLAVSTA